MKHETAFQRHGLFDARVPRYTSYPPANRFEPQQGDGVARDWMARVPAGSDVSFYLHLPFCRRLCWFCACRTQGTKTDGPVESYLDGLLDEIELAARMLAPVRAARVHIGGGTPTLMTPAMVTRLMSRLDRRFRPADCREFSVEIDPTEVDRPRLEALVGAGLNRASLGVQDFDARVQAAIGRQQSYEETETCIAMLRDLGVRNINLDILYGLPFQSGDTLDATLDKVLSLDPDRIAVFGYAHVPWMSRRQTLIPADALPAPRDRLRLFLRVARRLGGAGYVRIGIDHFVKPTDGLARALAEGRLHRNFQGYTDDASAWLIGLGASAISRHPQGFLQNATSTGDYLARIREGHLAMKRGVTMTPSQHLTARLIESLMCYGRIELADFSDSAGAGTDGLEARLAELAREFAPLVRLTDGMLHVEKDAYPLLRVIAARLDEVTPDGTAHAVAV